MYVKLEICVEDAINELSAMDKTALAIEMVKDNLDITEIIDAAKGAGYTDKDILNEIDIDDIITHIKSQGYNVEN